MGFCKVIASNRVWIILDRRYLYIVWDTWNIIIDEYICEYPGGLWSVVPRKPTIAFPKICQNYIKTDKTVENSLKKIKWAPSPPPKKNSTFFYTNIYLDIFKKKLTMIAQMSCEKQYVFQLSRYDRNRNWQKTFFISIFIENLGVFI